jgi:hypothetical protein
MLEAVSLLDRGMWIGYERTLAFSASLVDGILCLVLL